MDRPLTAKDILDSCPSFDPETERQLNEALAEVYERVIGDLPTYGTPPSADILADLAKLAEKRRTVTE